MADGEVLPQLLELSASRLLLEATCLCFAGENQLDRVLLVKLQMMIKGVPLSSYPLKTDF